MKRGIGWIIIFILWTMAAEAQVKSGIPRKNNKGTVTKTSKKAALENTATIQNLITHGQYQAKKPTFGDAAMPYTISDPTILTYNQRAIGADVAVDGKSILGVPKIVYGVGNGRILFRSRGATSSGTGTGNGAVGSGSSLGAVGTNGVALGVNGKSPNAGPIMDGIIVVDVNNQQGATTKKDRQLKPPQKD